MEDYFLYIDDLPYPEKVRMLNFILFKKKRKTFYAIENFIAIAFTFMTEKG